MIGLAQWKKEEPDIFVTTDELRKEIKGYEKKYNMTSSKLLELINSGNEPDGERDEIADWRILLEWLD